MKEKLLLNPPKQEKILFIESEKAKNSCPVAQSQEEFSKHIDNLNNSYNRLAGKDF